MDTDLALVNLALEQEVLKREAGTNKDKAVDGWTQTEGCRHMQRCANTAVSHLDGNSFQYEPEQRNQDT